LILLNTVAYGSCVILGLLLLLILYFPMLSFFRKLFGLRDSEQGFARFLGIVTDGCLYALVALIPVWFLPFTLNMAELNKQLLLLVLVLIALLAWVGHGLLTRSFSLARGWLHLVVLVFFFGYGLISLFSQDRYASFVGDGGQIPWAFVTIASCVAFYFLVANRFRDHGQMVRLIQWFILGSLVAALYGIFQIFGVHLIGGNAVNALGVFLTVPMALALSLLVVKGGDGSSLFWRIVLWALLAAGTVLAVLIDYWVVWIGFLFASALVVGIPLIRHRRVDRPVLLIAPGVLAILSILLLFVQTPLPFQTPLEVLPSMTHGWQIAHQTLRDMPLFGSGPGTWTMDYARYRSADSNLSPFWNVRFDQGASVVLTLIATVGVVGVALAVLLVISALSQGAMYLTREKEDASWQLFFVIFVGWAVAVLAAFLYHYTVASQLAFWLLLGLMSALLVRDARTWNRTHASGAMTALSFFFVILAISAVALLWLAGQRYVAEIRYAQAVRGHYADQPVDQSIAFLLRAVSLNPFADVYYRNLAQAHLAAAQALISASSPEAGDQREAIQAQIIAANTRAGQAIQLNPANVDNWANAALVAESLMTIMPDADVQAVQAYQGALAREPHNPQFMNAIGKALLFHSENVRQTLGSLEESARPAAEAEMNNSLQNAEMWFRRALAAKADYAPALFNIGILYDHMGEVEKAVTSMERIVEMFPEDHSARWALAGVYEHAGRYDDAIAQIQLIADADPESTPVMDRLKELQDAKNTSATSTPPTP
jgi:tetratricopeptide (TPR) repeat protein